MCKEIAVLKRFYDFVTEISNTKSELNTIIKPELNTINNNSKKIMELIREHISIKAIIHTRIKKAKVEAFENEITAGLFNPFPWLTVYNYEGVQSYTTACLTKSSRSFHAIVGIDKDGYEVKSKTIEGLYDKFASILAIIENIKNLNITQHNFRTTVSVPFQTIRLNNYKEAKGEPDGNVLDQNGIITKLFKYDICVVYLDDGVVTIGEDVVVVKDVYKLFTKSKLSYVV